MSTNTFLMILSKVQEHFHIAKEHLVFSRVQDFQLAKHRIGSEMVSMLASSAVDRGFESRSGQNKDYKICICCFFAKHATLRRKSKD